MSNSGVKMTQSDGSIECLRKYVDMRIEAHAKLNDTRFESQEKAVASALASAERAVAKSETAVERRFEDSNEWRATVESLQRSYTPRTETEQAQRMLNDKVVVIEGNRVTDLAKLAEFVPREVWEQNHRRLEDSLSSLARIVYIGMGLAIAGEIALYWLRLLAVK